MPARVDGTSRSRDRLDERRGGLDTLNWVRLTMVAVAIEMSGWAAVNLATG